MKKTTKKSIRGYTYKIAHSISTIFFIIIVSLSCIVGLGIAVSALAIGLIISVLSIVVSPVTYLYLKIREKRS